MHIINHPIGRRRRIKALFCFFYWQISSKLKITITSFSFVEGTRLHINLGQTISTGNYYVGLLEFEEMAFTLHFLNKNDTFFDIGANIGVYSILASGVIMSSSIAFEPIASTFLALQKNIALNQLQNKIQAFNIGLAETNGKLNFTTNLDAKNHIATTNEASMKIKEIEVKTLNEFIKFQPNLIKADVEGYEEFILKGGRDIRANESLKAIIIEVNHEGHRYNVEENSIHNILTFYNFRLYSYNPFKRELCEIQNLTNKDNRIYIRDFQEVFNRIKKSPSYSVFGLNF